MFSPVEEWIQDELNTATSQLSMLINSLNQQTLGGIDSMQAAISNQTSMIYNEVTTSSRKVEAGITSINVNLLAEVGSFNHYYHTIL